MAQTPTQTPPPSPARGLGLGLDAGGSATRWALAHADGTVLAQGEVAALSGLQLSSAEGRQACLATLQALGLAIQQTVGGVPYTLLAGITGFDAAQAPLWRELALAALHLPAHLVHAVSDLELTCKAAFAPGHGCVLMAGTGSVAAFVDAQGQLHRAGGRGAVLDDAGGAHWLARQALQHIWRAEDQHPGAWRNSALAQRVFDHLGGHDWARTRAWVTGASRGEVGLLAQAVAQAADQDPAAAALLRQAGTELARLVHALLQRGGPPVVALHGRVFVLHPLVRQSLAGALPSAVSLQGLQTPVAVAAARLAAQASATGN